MSIPPLPPRAAINLQFAEPDPLAHRQLNMCGRIVDYLEQKEIVEHYKVDACAESAAKHRPNYNVRPTTPVRAVRLDSEGRRELVALRWGFLRHWSNKAWINAAAETLAKPKSMWGNALASRRCLVPVSGFFEWHQIRPN